MKKVLTMIVSSAALLLSCGGGQQTKPDFSDNEYAVRTIAPQVSETSQKYPATIKGIQDVDIHPKIAGFITKIHVKEGQRVGKGQMLFEIDNETYKAQVNQAQAAIESAEAGVRQAQAAISTSQTQLNTAKLSYDNAKQLHASNVIGDYELQTSRNTYEAAKSQCEAAKSALGTAQAGVQQAKAAYAAAKQTLDFCYVKSPASGVVGTLPFKVGALVSAADKPLTSVADNSSMYVYFSLSEKQAMEIQKRAGSSKGAVQAFPSVQLLLADGTVYNHLGRVEAISGVIDEATGSVQIKAVFPNGEGLLKSGGAGQIIIPEKQDAAVIIPQDACVEVQEKHYVYIVGAGNKVKYTEIEVAPNNDGKNYVVTKGLKVGDKIVINGVNSLTDGMEIRTQSEADYQKKLKANADLAKSQDNPEEFAKAMKGK
ncbi:MAG: efflux RND transporter periplasmic adaptor subunit [Bacteroidaceae bacterium]|nr:efflux RND transporter periplasmic adaptor subunit [Bacteroidaceae bacterium]